MALPSDSPRRPAVEETIELPIADLPGVSLAVRLGRYKLIEKIGAGGMGEVFLGEDERLNRKVALKLLPARFTQDAGRVRRFELEAKAASALNHPNIITIYEIGEADGAHYIATEYIEGQTLRQRMAHRLTIGMALDVGAQMLRFPSGLRERRAPQKAGFCVLIVVNFLIELFGRLTRCPGREQSPSPMLGCAILLVHHSGRKPRAGRLNHVANRRDSPRGLHSHWQPCSLLNRQDTVLSPERDQSVKRTV